MLKFRTYFILFFIGFIYTCNPFSSKSNNDWGLFALLSLGGATNTDPSTLPEPVNTSSKPNIVLPPVFGDQSIGFQATESKESVPSSVEGNYVPIGKIYDVGLNWDQIEGIEKEEYQTIQFGTPVELRYSYDKEALYDAGFMEEFMVFYFDSSTQEWLPVSGIRIDYEKHEVIAITDHFTPFVLTALPIPQGTGVSTAPACISNEAPISGSGNASWTVVGENFKYYKDRNYIIQTNADFYSLGFENALGIATCNGGTPQAGLNNCGLFSDHKNFSGTNYIQFKAPKPINVFVMYDRRGPSNATWLANDGWTDTGMNIATTDAVGQYKVFAKAFSTNEQVSIHGNWNGISGPTSINTNLWVVVKEQGGSYYSTPSDVCQSGNTGISKLENVFGIPGSNKNTLLWELPENSNIQNVLIRRQLNFPTLSPNGGQPATGTELGENGYSDLGLTQGLTYYYSIFTLDQNGGYSTAKVVELTTGVDNDGDGIKDGFELNPDHIYDSGLPTLANNADSDGDGINDLQEIIDQTDPRNPDSIKPVINNFTLTSESPTQMPIAFFHLNATDNIGITHWIYTSTDKKPRKNNPNWTDVKPSYATLESMQTYDFYIWAKDAAGNISNVYSPVQVVLDGLKYPKFVFAADYDSSIIKTYKYNLLNKSLELVNSFNTGKNLLSILIHPSNEFLIASISGSNNSGFFILKINQSDGSLSLNQYLPREYTQSLFNPRRLKFDNEGKFLYSNEAKNVGGQIVEHLITYKFDYTYNTLSEHSSFNYGKIFEPGDLFVGNHTNFILHPLNDTIFIETGNGDPCGYAMRRLNNGEILETISVSDNFKFDCSRYTGNMAIFNRSGKFLYTTISLSNISSLIRNGNSISFSTNVSIPNTDYLIWGQIIPHPNLEVLYLVRSKNSKIIIHSYSIDNSPLNEGGLIQLANPYEIPLPSGNNPIKDAIIFPTGSNILVTDVVRGIYSIELDKITGIPSSHTHTPNAGTQIASLSINNTNEPPITSVMNTGGNILNKGLSLFNNYCIISPTVQNWGFYYFNEYCQTEMIARDQDTVRCNSSPANLNLTISIFGSGISNQIVSTSTLNNGNKKRTISAKFDFTGSYLYDYSVTDDAGNCMGGNKTSSGKQPIVIKRPKIGPEVRISESVNQAPSTTKKFLINQTGRQSETWFRKTCEVTWKECGIYLKPNNLKLEFICNTKSKLDYQYFQYGSGQSCQYRFPPISPLEAFLGKRWVDKGTTSTKYYFGRWIELED